MNRGWLELESDPGLFTLLVEDFGVKGVQVEEIYDLQKPIEGTAYGFIFLFRWIEERRSRRKLAQEVESFVMDDEIINCMFFAQQLIPNSCATHALLSVLLNCDGDKVQLGDMLSRLKQFTKGMSPEDKGFAIGNMPDLSRAHNSHARPEPCRMPERQQGITAGRVQETFHFVSYVPINGHLFELDGLKPYPIDHGPGKDSESWTETFRHVITERLGMATGSEPYHDIRFNLMAVVPDRRVQYEKKLKMLKANQQIILDALQQMVQASPGSGDQPLQYSGRAVLTRSVAREAAAVVAAHQSTPVRATTDSKSWHKDIAELSDGKPKDEPVELAERLVSDDALVDLSRLKTEHSVDDHVSNWDVGTGDMKYSDISKVMSRHHSAPQLAMLTRTGVDMGPSEEEAAMNRRLLGGLQPLTVCTDQGPESPMSPASPAGSTGSTTDTASEVASLLHSPHRTMSLDSLQNSPDVDARTVQVLDHVVMNSVDSSNKQGIDRRLTQNLCQNTMSSLDSAALSEDATSLPSAGQSVTSSSDAISLSCMESAALFPTDITAASSVDAGVSSLEQCVASVITPGSTADRVVLELKVTELQAKLTLQLNLQTGDGLSLKVEPVEDSLQRLCAIHDTEAGEVKPGKCTPSPTTRKRFTPKDLLALLKNVESEISTCDSNLRDEIEKRKKYKIDDCRRTHNYDPFVRTFLSMLAEHGHLSSLVEQHSLSKRRQAAVPNAHKRRRTSSVKKKRGKTRKR